jgi:hypothetical protein
MKSHRPPAFPFLLLGVALFASVNSAGAQEQPNLRPFSAEQRRALAQKAAAAERVAATAKGQRLRALSVVPQQVEKDGQPAIVAVVTFVNYGTGSGLRVMLDPVTGLVQASEPIKGRPQSSAEEREEARQLLQKSPEIAELLKAQARIEGGFVVDAPAGQPAAGRYLEFHVVTADGQKFLAEAIVDLARSQVAGIRREGGEGRAS